MAKPKRRAARKRKTSMNAAKEAQDEINRRNSAYLHRTEGPTYQDISTSEPPLRVSDILEMVQATAHTLRTMRARITQLEVENTRLQTLVDKASYH